MNKLWLVLTLLFAPMAPMVWASSDQDAKPTLISIQQIQSINQSLHESNLPPLNNYFWWWFFGSDDTGTSTDKVSKLNAFIQSAQKDIVGQEMPKELLINLLTVDAVGLRDEEKPVGCCLFLGPSGVGKTLLAKTAAKHYMGASDNFLLINMAEYTASHEISKLIGSPPGYIGYSEGGLLTNFLIDHPNGVIILDEFEKAHSQVQKLFLGVFDQGLMHGGDKTEINCSQALFIATSNLESSRMINLIQQGLTPEEALKIVEKNITQVISPELYGRMSKAIFNPLSDEELSQIYSLEVRKISDGIYRKRKLILRVEPSVKEHVLSKDYNIALGARPLIGVLHHELTSAVAFYLLSHNCKAGQTLVVEFIDDKYSIHTI